MPLIGEQLSDAPSLSLPSGKVVNLVAEDYCLYLVDYVTCETQLQRPIGGEAERFSVRTVAGFCLANPVEVSWGVQKHSPATPDDDHGSDGTVPRARPSNVDHGSDGTGQSAQPTWVGRTVEKYIKQGGKEDAQVITTQIKTRV